MQPCPGYPDAVPPVTLDVTWSGTPQGGSGRSNSRYQCGSYSAATVATFVFGSAFTAINLSALPESLADSQATMSFSEQQFRSKGTPIPFCQPTGGRGAGGGPLGPGVYDFSSNLAAFVQSESDLSDPQIGLSLFEPTTVFNPKGATSSTSTETDLFVEVSTNGDFVFACFVLPSPMAMVFNKDLSGATVHAYLTSDTPRCEPSFGDFQYLPVTVDFTLTGTGPVATGRTTGHGPCLNTELVDQINNANGTATLSAFPGVTFTGSQSVIGTTDHRFEIQSASPCPDRK